MMKADTLANMLRHEPFVHGDFGAVAGEVTEVGGEGVSARVCVYACNKRTHVYVHLYGLVGVYVCMYIYIRVCMHVCTYTYAYVCVYVYVYVYVHKMLMSKSRTSA